MVRLLRVVDRVGYNKKTMIISALLTFLAWVLAVVFSPWPKVTSLPESWTWVSELFAAIGGLAALPVLGTVIEVLLLALTFVVTWQAIVFANWLYNKLRGSG